MKTHDTPAPVTPLRLVVVDDHKMVREALVGLLNRQGGLEVCGEADSVESGIEVADELQPDLVLVDLMLQGRDGLELVRHLHTHHPKTRTLVITMNEGDAFSTRARAAGANGYITKDMLTEEIDKAIDAVRSGGVWYPHHRA